MEPSNTSRSKLAFLKLPATPSKVALVVNLTILLVIISVNFYILWGLFGPRVTLEVQKAVTDPPKISQNDNSKPPADNRLIIPSIYLDTKINEGATEQALIGGVWRRPNTNTPELGGNTVIAGHRFTYQGTSIFYNLDKVKIGDEIGVWYNGKLYKYTASKILIVSPVNNDIESAKQESMITLYTCTPMWTSKERLVVIGSPIGDNQ